ncbi:MAG: aspartyl beta-hydroxylase [Erysipelotrichaceae bacterium]|nr:aspartyl beta-hydroxylase [Erysipelotrichaceae bacterium]
MNYFSEDLKKILLAGVGAVALSAEKSKEVIDTLVKKGELTVEQGKVINEELKRNVKEKLKDPVDVDSVNRDLEKLDKDELEALKAKIEELQANNESE